MSRRVCKKVRTVWHVKRFTKWNVKRFYDRNIKVWVYEWNRRGYRFERLEVWYREVGRKENGSKKKKRSVEKGMT